MKTQKRIAVGMFLALFVTLAYFAVTDTKVASVGPRNCISVTMKPETVAYEKQFKSYLEKIAKEFDLPLYANPLSHARPIPAKPSQPPPKPAGSPAAVASLRFGDARLLKE